MNGTIGMIGLARGVAIRGEASARVVRARANFMAYDWSCNDMR